MAEILRAAGVNLDEFDSLATCEETLRLTERMIPPHLIDYRDAQRCSLCKMPFPPDAECSQEEAFEQHVREAHRS
jgi:hypothetical protein